MESGSKKLNQLDRIIALIRQGIVSPIGLAKQTGLCKRQVYRYLNLALEKETIYSPVRGVYYPSDIKIIPLEEFVSLHSKSVNVCMSQKEQHNKTEQNDSSLNLVDFNSIKKHKNYERINMLSENVTNATSKMSLQEVIIEALEIAQMPYSVRDLKYAKNALSNSAWWLITEENIREYTLETIRRMSERLDHEPKCIKMNAVGYFFGILRNVVSCDARLAKKKWVQLLASYSQVAAGAEEVAVAACEENQDSKSASLVSTAISDSKQEKLRLRVAPAVWHKAQDILNSMIQKFSLYKPKQLETPVLDILNYLDKEEISAQNVENALNDVITHDEKAARYLVNLIKSGSAKKIQEQLDKHFWRSVVRDSKDSPGTENKPKDKYETFYELFPG